jgi:hypothetical protein
MNYIWDLAIKSAAQGQAQEEITFKPAQIFSPYLELALDDLNTAVLESDPQIEINPYYRFYSIFKNLVDINFLENAELRTTLFDVLTHYLLWVDLFQGFNKREYYLKFVAADLKNGVFGAKAKEITGLFSTEETQLIAHSLISLYLTHASIHLFKKIVRQIFTDSIIYYRAEDFPEALIYLGVKDEDTARRKIDLLLELFLPLGFAYRLYWEKHFGIIGIDATMSVDNIVIY